MNNNPKIFFSYAWGDNSENGESREKLVNELYQSLVNDHYNVIRDKIDLGYRGFISDFMHSIGNGDFIIIAISNKYVHSPYCMFELYEIARQSGFDKYKFRDKVLPVVVEFINFAKPETINELLNYWQGEFDCWNDLVKEKAGQLSIEKMERYNRIKLVYQNFDKLTEWLADMNTMNAEILSQDNFAMIKKVIASKIPTPASQQADEKNEEPKNNTLSTPAPVADYKLPNIRKLLMNAFTDGDLTNLLMDYFPEVNNKLSDGMNKQQKINLLLDYCRRQMKFPELLDAAKDTNNEQFEVYKPYQ